MRRKRNVAYNRQTVQYRKNVQRGELNKAGVKAPKLRNNPLLKKITFGAAITWAILCFVLIFINFKLSLLLVLVGVIAASILIAYVNHKDKGLIETYIRMGIKKEAFNEALRKRGVGEKQTKRINKMWDKAEKRLS